MANAFKLFDSATGLIVYRDCLTGVELTAEDIAAIKPCPKQELLASDACIQPIGNTDPALVESGAKQVCMFETTFLPDETIGVTTLVGTTLVSGAGVDVTATHEATACPVPLMPVGEVCYN